MPVAELKADAPLTPQELTVENIQGLTCSNPSALTTKSPLFYIENAADTRYHPAFRRCSLKAEDKIRIHSGGRSYVQKISASLLSGKGDICDMIVSLGINEFRGNVSVASSSAISVPTDFEQSNILPLFPLLKPSLRGEELPENYYPSMYPSREDDGENIQGPSPKGYMLRYAVS